MDQTLHLIENPIASHLLFVRLDVHSDERVTPSRHKRPASVARTRATN